MISADKWQTKLIAHTPHCQQEVQVKTKLDNNHRVGKKRYRYICTYIYKNLPVLDSLKLNELNLNTYIT